MLIKTRLPEDDHERREAIFRRMQIFLRAIKDPQQQDSMLQPDGLEWLGNEYASTLVRIATLAERPGLNYTRE